MEKTVEMLITSFWVMLFGMGIVFLFLSILIFSVNIAHKILDALHLNKVEVPENVQRGSGNTGNDKAKNAAIAAAVNRYRNEK